MFEQNPSRKDADAAEIFWKSFVHDLIDLLNADEEKQTFPS